MSKPSDSPCRYQIVFRTECGTVLADVLDDAVIESRDGYTCVVATVRDQSEFYGLLDRFAALALWPVSLIELGAERLATRTGEIRLFARRPTPDPPELIHGG
jgi:hypothetical protein